MVRMCSLDSAWNTTVASTRLRNSGRKARFSSSSTFPFMRLYWASAVFACSVSTLKPSADSLRIRSEPMLLVMTMIVFRKSTLRPFASVRWPSSKIWSRMLKTSGCAFSISSRRIRQYDLRRTVSVNWPPSS